ncbi:MAG: CBS domain-containing protein, partial [Cyanobacteria bacterium J083]
MEINEQLLPKFNLMAAINHDPLILAPQTTLEEAIALMSQSRGKSCLLPTQASNLEPLHMYRANSSCALIMEQEQLIGILTERDIVKLTAAEIEFTTVTVADVMTQPVLTLAQENFQDIFAALFLFRRYKIRHLPIVDREQKLIGVVSPETIRQATQPANLLKLRRVADVMSKYIIHAPTTTPVLDLTKIMARHQVSCVVITQTDHIDETITPVGIITERDIMQFQCLQLNLSQIQAAEVMSTPLFLLSPEDSLLTAYQSMAEKRVRRLVVSWNWGRSLGIITQTSLFRIFDPMEMYSVIETLQTTIKHLQA